jgi:TPP-dependent pyruvate/acetoin dehydrogenase alpha subunit
MPGLIVDGQDVEAVYAATAEAVARARSGGGPTLLEMKTYRYRGHSRSDPARYRPPGELEAWKARDPIDLLGRRLAETGQLSAQAQEQIRAEIQAEIDAAATRALAAPYPTLEEAARYVYAD